jgi:hypothetical protein
MVPGAFEATTSQYSNQETFFAALVHWVIVTLSSSTGSSPKGA